LTIVENGLEAVKAIAIEDFDIVLMEVQMPIMNGFEATQKMRDFKGSKNETKIVALTASAFQEDMEQCFDSGMDAYVSMPIHFNELKNIVTNLNSHNNSQMKVNTRGQND